MRQTLSILVEKGSSELARIVGLFSVGGYNIESLTVAESLEPQFSRVTLVTNAEPCVSEEIVKRLENQVGVLSVVNLSLTNHIEREMALLHVKTTSPGDRSEIMKLAEIFEAKVIAAARETLTVQAVAERERLKELLELLQSFGICEIARAGTLAIGKM